MRLRDAKWVVVRPGQRPAPRKACGVCSGRNTEPRIDPATWGPLLWQELHARPDRAELSTESGRAAERDWIAVELPARIPCRECRDHWLALLTELPPALGSATAYREWTVVAHDRVNTRLGKPVPPPVSLLSYRAARNLGDAMQTVAMERLLAGRPLSYRERDSDAGERAGVHVCNGYLDARWQPSAEGVTIFAGVHATDARVAERIAAHTTGPVGARDPHTLALLQGLGVPCEMVGCATLTLPRLTGPRAGVLRIDAAPADGDQIIAADASWQDQRRMADARIALLARLELVVTTRLHIVLPCLALGTPVMVPAGAVAAIPEPARLGLLEALGFTFGAPQVLDVSAAAARYRAFLAARLAELA